MTLSTQTHLDALEKDARIAARSRETGPADVIAHDAIVGALTEAEGAFPPEYETGMRAPLLETFRRIGPRGWGGVLDGDPLRRRAARLGLDLIQSVAQRADPDRAAPIEAFQEVIADLYDGFLSDVDRAGVKPPDRSVLPPLVKWGQPASGPYIWPAPSAAGYGCATGVVNMPPAFASGGLAAWSALGHEGGGHAILHADTGLHDDLAAAVAARIEGAKPPQLGDKAQRRKLAEYWARKIDETGSDVLGTLNMGPAAGVGLIAYFRAIRRGGKLLATGTRSPHPTDIARGFLIAETVGMCDFPEAAAWRRLLTAEVMRDVPDAGVRLDGAVYSAAVTRVSAKLAAEAIMMVPVDALEKHRMTDIQTWTAEDNRIVQILTSQVFLGDNVLPTALHGGVFAAHAVAAAVMAALLDGRVGAHQARMIDVLAEMHASNIAWTELRFAHSGAFAPPHAHDVSASFAGPKEWDEALRSGAGGSTGALDNRMIALARRFGQPAPRGRARRAHGSDISIPFGLFAAEGDDGDAGGPVGSDIDIPFGFVARRCGLEVEDGSWRLADGETETPLHNGLTGDILALVLGAPR